jgi:hypothetical protein
MPELLLPPKAKAARIAQVAAQQRGKGLGEAIYDEDPAEKIIKQVNMVEPGVIISRRTGKQFRLHGNRVLVGVYERPRQIKAGENNSLFLPDGVLAEDEHQGKAGLVLMKGWSAFASDDHFQFYTDHADIGEWISLWVSDGRKIIINGQLCRIVRDQDINMVIPEPDCVY